MSRTRICLIAIASAVAACGQSVISAHSGTLQYTEGTVTIDGASVQPKFGQFPEIKPGQVLATTEGRAEVLLTPGVFLRMSEDSSFKMVSNQLSDTRLEMQSGAAMLEVTELLEGNAISIAFKGATVSLAKSGLYRFDAVSDPATLKVYEGEAKLEAGDQNLSVGKGHEIAFGGAKLEAKGFDSKATDEFYRWSARRDEYVAEANITSAKATRDAGYSGMGYNAMGMSGMGQWAFNPWFGMYTYVPYSGTFFSPYGFGYFSPFDIGYMYGPYSPFYYGNGFYNGAGGGGVGRSVPTVATSASSITRAGGLSGAVASRGGLSTVGGSRFGSAASAVGFSSGGRGGFSGGGASAGGMSAGSGGGHASMGSAGGMSGGGHASAGGGGHH